MVFSFQGYAIKSIFKHTNSIKYPELNIK